MRDELAARGARKYHILTIYKVCIRLAYKHYDKLAELVESRGGILIFLPPCSPDFSPIESIQ